MTREEFRHPKAEVGRVVLNGHPRYALIVNADEIALSLHEPFDRPGTLMLAGFNERGDYRPARLNRAEAEALRDALEIYLSEIPNPPAKKD